ncbi:MAG: thiamine phosphate synthase [Bryobacteraceae bacterium]
MTLPRVYPILDTDALGRRGLTLAAAAEAFLQGGARILQIRHKGHWSRAVHQEAIQVVELCRRFGAIPIVNDRADCARLFSAGLHLGQEDLAPKDARGLMGAGAVVGFSTHNAAQAAIAAGEPVDYVALGPIFSTSSKRNPDPVVGLEELRRCRNLTAKPLVAIGGITAVNAPAVFEAGADSVAVIANLLPDATTPGSLRQRMEEWQAIVH